MLVQHTYCSKNLLTGGMFLKMGIERLAEARISQPEAQNNWSRKNSCKNVVRNLNLQKKFKKLPGVTIWKQLFLTTFFVFSNKYPKLQTICLEQEFHPGRSHHTRSQPWSSFSTSSSLPFPSTEVSLPFSTSIERGTSQQVELKTRKAQWEEEQTAN